MRTKYDFITPYMLAQGLVQVHIAFDESGELVPETLATLLLAEFRQRPEIRRTLNDEGHICFLFSREEWADLYTVMGMSRDKWADTMKRVEKEGYIRANYDENGGRSLRFFLEVAAPH